MLNSSRLGPHPASLAELGALIGDPVRASILLHLSDGSRRPAGELARLAGASPQAVSAHLARLVDGGLLAVEPQGRHRFFRIASGEAAEVIENLANWIDQPPRHIAHDPALRHARLCYDHLAGQLGVSLFEQMSRRGLFAVGADGPELSQDGLCWCRSKGLPYGSPARSRRPLLRLCLDWTERRHHLGGHLGARLTGTMFEAGLVVCGAKPRTVDVTARGARFLRDEFGLMTGL